MHTGQSAAGPELMHRKLHVSSRTCLVPVSDSKHWFTNGKKINLLECENITFCFYRMLELCF